MRVPRRRGLGAALVALVLSAALAACGSSGPRTVSASAYVRALCNAVVPFERDVVARSSGANLGAIRSPAQAKQVLEGLLAAISADAQHTTAQLRAAGTPDVQHGARIAGAIISAFSQLSGALERASAQARSVPTTSASAFRTGAQTLILQVRSSMIGIGTNLGSGTLNSPALKRAAAAEPACAPLTGAA